MVCFPGRGGGHSENGESFMDNLVEKFGDFTSFHYGHLPTWSHVLYKYSVL